MKRRFYALGSYALFWLFFFFTARAFFIVTHWGEASASNTGEIALTFFHGLKLDISATGYIFMLPLLVMIPGLIITGRWFTIFIRWYSYLIIAASSIIVISDSLLYKFWGFRMDYTPFLYLNTPGEAAASVTVLQAVSVFAGIAALTSLFIFLFRKFVARYFDGFIRIKPAIPAILLFMVLWTSLIIPIRGGTGIAPINAGTVYFSEQTFINHSAVNVVWNVGSSAVNNKPSKNPYNYLDKSEAEAMVKTLTSGAAPPIRVINTDRPNVLILVLESFGSAFTGPLGGDTITTPRFNELCREGVLFSHFYASGFRTDKAMPAILNGYPAQPAASIMKEPAKTQKLPSLVKTLVEKGYKSSFWYGGNINFANFNSFIINNGFSTIITQDNFDPDFRNSKWGIHDHILFEAFRDSMTSAKEPFINVVLSLSSHEPFEVPMEPVFEGTDETTKFRNSVYYIDRTLGDFIDQAKTMSWWKNTIVIILADHFRRNAGDVMVHSEDIFQIPMLWTGGAVSLKDTVISKYGSQTDIPLTLLRQMGLDGEYPFARDLLSPDTHSFAFYTFNEGFGFITDSTKYIFDHKLGAPVVSSGNGAELTGKYGKAYLQLLFDDYLNR